jgi:hypothetical protein
MSNFTHFNTTLKLLGDVEKGLEAQTTAQIQDDVTNNFTIQEKTSGIVWDAFDTGRLEL